MKEEYNDKTKEQHINEEVGLRQRIAELEASENERKKAEEERKRLLKELEAKTAEMNGFTSSFSTR